MAEDNPKKNFEALAIAIGKSSLVYEARSKGLVNDVKYYKLEVTN